MIAVKIWVCFLLSFVSLASSAPLGWLLPFHRKDTNTQVCSSLGCTKGHNGNGAVRFTLPFAQPPVGDLRFANPVPVGKFNSTYDASKTAPSCYQGPLAPRGGNPVSEDCLYMNVFVPTGATPSSKLPVLVWVPGGSFIGGSATAAGLDGSALAAAENVIVIVTQYRLGMFGFLQTSSLLDESNGGKAGDKKVAGNQGIRDIVAALAYVQQNIESYGGDKDSVLLMGQSSGAHAVRTILTIPDAKDYFARAISVSDTSDYGISSATQADGLGELGLKSLGCAADDISCARSKSPDEVLNATFQAFSTYPTVDPSTPAGEVYRPVQGSYIPSSLEKDVSSGKGIGKDVIFTTVSNESGTAIGNNFYMTPPNASTIIYADGDKNYTFTLAQAEDFFFNAGRGDAAAASSLYVASPEADGLRILAEEIATDGLWRCANQLNAVNTQSTGSKVWLAQINLGITYPSSKGNDYCDYNSNARKVVCHEDDIQLIFNNYAEGSTPNAAQKKVSQELQSRYASFARTGNPNPSKGGYLTWNGVQGSENLNLLMVGDDKNSGSSKIYQTQREGICGGKGNGLWGNTIQFDWQLYG